MSRPEVVWLRAEPGESEAGLRARARAGSASGARPVDGARPIDGARTVASRSYRFPVAVVAIWGGPVGVDVERIDPALDRAFAESISTPDEITRFALGWDDPGLVAELWCGKEAVAKCLGDAVAYDPRRLDAPLGWPLGEAGVRAAGRLRAAALPAPEGHVAWLCWAATAV